MIRNYSQPNPGKTKNPCLQRQGVAVPLCLGNKTALLVIGNGPPLRPTSLISAPPLRGALQRCLTGTLSALVSLSGGACSRLLSPSQRLIYIHVYQRLYLLQQQGSITRTEDIDKPHQTIRYSRSEHSRRRIKTALYGGMRFERSSLISDF